VALKVYYLDDEVDLLELFQDMFSSADVEITTFSDPELAIKTSAEIPPDLIFLDYRLPNTTGVKVALRLDPSIPKVLVTGELNSDDEFKFNSVILKPYRASEVRQTLESYLKLTKPNVN
jgi:CheY-like chemotaxis protein